MTDAPTQVLQRIKPETRKRLLVIGAILGPLGFVLSICNLFASKAAAAQMTERMNQLTQAYNTGKEKDQITLAPITFEPLGWMPGISLTGVLVIAVIVLFGIVIWQAQRNRPASTPTS